MAAEKKINNVHYRFEPLVGWDEWEAMQRLTRIASRFAGLLEAVGEKDDAKRSAAMARAIPDMVAKFDDGEFRAFADSLFASCRADGAEVVVGVKPQRLDDILQVIVFMVEAQFSGFFGGTFVAWVRAAIKTAEPDKAEPEADA